MLFAQHNAPGFTAAYESEETEVLRVGINGQDQASLETTLILSSTVDSGNVPTTTIRGGRVMGHVDASGKAQLYGAPSTDDGRDVVRGILRYHTSTLQNGVAVDRFTSILKSGLIDVNKLIGADAKALAVLARMGFLLNTDDGTPHGACFGVHAKREIRKDDDYTVLAAENGCLFIQTGADKTFTLPTIANGLCFEFLNASFAAVDDTMIINGASNILFGGSATADTITSAAGGGFCRLRAMYTDGSTLKWVPELTGSWS